MTARLAFTRSFLLSLLGLALLMRGLIPVGWMPTGEKAFAIAICTGMETQQVWMTPDGTIHKTDPSKKEHKQDGDGGKACPFASAAMPMLAELADAPVIALSVPRAPIISGADAVTVGRGLAAPPPPSTGPPVLI